MPDTSEHEHEFEPSARDFDGNVTEERCARCGFIKGSDADAAAEEAPSTGEEASSTGEDAPAEAV